MTILVSGRRVNEKMAAAGVELDEEGNAKPARIRKFPVVEIFGPTIQGEGAMLGEQTMFVRFGGCDFRCLKCDSLHAVLPEQVQANSIRLTSPEIVYALQQGKPRPAKWVTLSGGNPVMHELDKLCDELHDADFAIAVETQGSLWRDWLMKCDHVTISPKGPGMGEVFNPDDFQVYMDKLGNRIAYRDWSVKVVIMNNVDIEFAVGLLEKWPFIRDRMYLSLGNPYPPQVATGGKGMSADEIRPKLLAEYTQIVEEILQDQRLYDCKVTPQLHVLFWGNQQGK